MKEINIANPFDGDTIESFDIPEDQLPRVIEEQFQSIVSIDEQVTIAHENCEKAKEIATQQIHAKRLNTTDAINSTQDAVRSLAEAQETLANAQKVLFEHQKRMADSMRYLLLLGASNMAMSRMVVKQLEEKLSQAQHERLSEQTKQELIGIIKILREQESAFSKQDRMSEQIADMSDAIETQQEEIESIHRVDEEQERKDAEHDQRIDENARKNRSQDIQIEASVRRDMVQDEEMKRQREIDATHDAQIKKNKILSWVSMGVATIAIILSILGFFI